MDSRAVADANAASRRGAVIMLSSSECRRAWLPLPRDLVLAGLAPHRTTRHRLEEIEIEVVAGHERAVNGERARVLTCSDRNADAQRQEHRGRVRKTMISGTAQCIGLHVIERNAGDDLSAATGEGAYGAHGLGMATA
jgi:hypothetical protein